MKLFFYKYLTNSIWTASNRVNKLDEVRILASIRINSYNEHESRINEWKIRRGSWGVRSLAATPNWFLQTQRKARGLLARNSFVSVEFTCVVPSGNTSVVMFASAPASAHAAPLPEFSSQVISGAGWPLQPHVRSITIWALSDTEESVAMRGVEDQGHSWGDAAYRTKRKSSELQRTTVRKLSQRVTPSWKLLEFSL